MSRSSIFKIIVIAIISLNTAYSEPHFILNKQSGIACFALGDKLYLWLQPLWSKEEAQSKFNEATNRLTEEKFSNSARCRLLAIRNNPHPYLIAHSLGTIDHVAASGNEIAFAIKNNLYYMRWGDLESISYTEPQLVVTEERAIDELEIPGYYIYYSVDSVLRCVSLGEARKPNPQISFLSEENEKIQNLVGAHDEYNGCFYTTGTIIKKDSPNLRKGETILQGKERIDNIHVRPPPLPPTNRPRTTPYLAECYYSIGASLFITENLLGRALGNIGNIETSDDSRIIVSVGSNIYLLNTDGTFTLVGVAPELIESLVHLGTNTFIFSHGSMISVATLNTQIGGRPWLQEVASFDGVAVTRPLPLWYDFFQKIFFLRQMMASEMTDLIPAIIRMMIGV